MAVQTAKINTPRRAALHTAQRAPDCAAAADFARRGPAANCAIAIACLRFDLERREWRRVVWFHWLLGDSGGLNV